MKVFTFIWKLRPVVPHRLWPKKEDDLCWFFGCFIYFITKSSLTCRQFFLSLGTLYLLLVPLGRLTGSNDRTLSKVVPCPSSLGSCRILGGAQLTYFHSQTPSVPSISKVLSHVSSFSTCLSFGISGHLTGTNLPNVNTQLIHSIVI